MTSKIEPMLKIKHYSDMETRLSSQQTVKGWVTGALSLPKFISYNLRKTILFLEDTANLITLLFHMGDRLFTYYLALSCHEDRSDTQAFAKAGNHITKAINSINEWLALFHIIHDSDILSEYIKSSTITLSFPPTTHYDPSLSPHNKPLV